MRDSVSMVKLTMNVFLTTRTGFSQSLIARRTLGTSPNTVERTPCKGEGDNFLHGERYSYSIEAVCICWELGSYFSFTSALQPTRHSAMLNHLFQNSERNCGLMYKSQV